MKIRGAWQVKAVGFAGSWLVRLWSETFAFGRATLGPEVDPGGPLGGQYIYALWHEYLFLPVHQYAGRGVHVLVSRHADGELLAEVFRHLRVPLVRGSTTRGGVAAVRALLRAGRRAHLALTPDGPRGPRRQVQPGVIYLASRLGLPVVPVGFGARRPWRLSSWDRMALPRPWSRVACVMGAPIAVPAGAGPGERETYRLRLENAMGDATAAAERWADGGRRPARRSGRNGMV